MAIFTSTVNNSDVFKLNTKSLFKNVFQEHARLRNKFLCWKNFSWMGLDLGLELVLRLGLEPFTQIISISDKK